MVGIYKITNPKGKIYIGQSVDLDKRKNTYKTLNAGVKGQPKLYNSLKKYSWEQHEWEIIIECNLEQLNEKEIYWGMYFDVLGKNGLNLKLGDAKGICSEETKQKMSQTHKGMKKPWAGMTMKLTKEHKEKLIKARKSTSNPVFQYDLKGNFIKEWLNPKQASIGLNLNQGYLWTIIDNPNKTLGGYRFTSIFYSSLPPTTRWENNKKLIIQYDLQNNKIQEWESAKAAALYYNIKIQGITACCRGEVKTCFKYIWKYA